MVDFSNTIFEGKIEPSTPRVQPVDDRSGETFAAGLAQGLDRFNTFFSASNEGKQDKIKGALFAEINDTVNLYADAREEGMSTDEVLRNLRVKTHEWTANHPELTDDIHTLINKMTSSSGLASNITRETPEETGLRKMKEEAIALGWQPNEMDAYVAHKRDLINLEAIATEVKKIEAENAIPSAQIKSRATTAMHSALASGLPWVTGQISKGMAELQTVTDPGQRQAIIDNVTGQINMKIATINELRSLSGDAVNTSYMIEGYTTLLKDFQEVAAGTRTTAAYEASVKNTDAKLQAMIYADPEIALLLAMSKSTNHANPEMMRRLDRKMVDLYARLGYDETSGQKPPDLVDSNQNVAPVFETLKSELEDISRGEADPEAVTDLNNKIVTVVKSINQFGQSETDARNFTAVIGFLSDPTVGKYMETNASQITPAVMAEAKSVVQRQYDEVVIPLITERWVEATAQINKLNPATTDEDLLVQARSGSAELGRVDVSSSIVPMWNGTGVEFRVAQGMEDNAILRGVAKELNTGSTAIAGPLNTLIRTSAHLNGSTDYEKEYNETYAPRLWQTGEGEGNKTTPAKPGDNQIMGIMSNPTSVDSPGDLEISDFNIEMLETELAKTTAADPKALAGAKNPMQFAQAYLGLNENNPEQAKALAAFIKSNTGTSLDPTKTAWCAAFVNAVLGASGSKGTNKLNARSYLAWGQAVDEPQLGDIVVIQRGGKNDWTGHVGFYMGENGDGTIRVLGGNQGDSVSEDDFDPKKVLGFRRAI